MKRLVALVCALSMIFLCGCENDSKDKNVSSQLSDEDLKAAITEDYEYYMGSYAKSVSYEENYKISVKDGDVTNSSTFHTFYSIKRDDDGRTLALTNETTAKVGKELITSYITYVDGKLYTESNSKRKIMSEMAYGDFIKYLSDATESIDITFDSFAKSAIKRTEKGTTLTLTEPDDICNQEAKTLLESLAKQVSCTAKEVTKVSVKADFNDKNKATKITLTINGLDENDKELQLEVAFTKLSKKSNVSAPKGAENYEKMTNASYYSLIENGFLSYLASQKQKVKFTHDIWLTDKKEGDVYARAVYTFDYSITEENGLEFQYISKDATTGISYSYKYANGYIQSGASQKEPFSAEEAATFLGEHLATAYIDMNSITDFTIKRENKKNVVKFTATDKYMQGMLDMIAKFYDVDYINATIKNCSIDATFDLDYNLISVNYTIKGTNVNISVNLAVQ